VGAGPETDKKKLNHSRNLGKWCFFLSPYPTLGTAYCEQRQLVRVNGYIRNISTFYVTKISFMG